MSKLNVGVGADFPIDAAEPRSQDDESFRGCESRHFRHRHRHGFGGRYGWRRGRFFYAAGPLALVVFIALISLAISYPMVVLGLVAVAAFAFAARHHRHHWHDHGDWRDRDDDRDDFGRRDRSYDPRDRDAGPQPDAPSAPSQARS